MTGTRARRLDLAEVEFPAPPLEGEGLEPLSRTGAGHAIAILDAKERPVGGADQVFPRGIEEAVGHPVERRAAVRRQARQVRGGGRERPVRDRGPRGRRRSEEAEVGGRSGRKRRRSTEHPACRMARSLNLRLHSWQMSWSQSTSTSSSFLGAASSAAPSASSSSSGSAASVCLKSPCTSGKVVGGCERHFQTPSLRDARSRAGGATAKLPKLCSGRALGTHTEAAGARGATRRAHGGAVPHAGARPSGPGGRTTGFLALDLASPLPTPRPSTTLSDVCC